MWGISSLPELLVGRAVVLGLVVAAFLRGWRGLAARGALIGLAVFLAITITADDGNRRGIAPMDTSIAVATPRLKEEAVPFTTAKAMVPRCSQPPMFAQDQVSEFSDRSIRYSLVSARSYPGVVNTASKVRTAWLMLGMKNQSTVPARSDPWFDFLLLPHPHSAADSAYPPHPVRADIIEIGGPVPVPAGQILLLEPGVSCSLVLAFQLGPKAERAVVFISYVHAFTIDLTSKGRE